MMLRPLLAPALPLETEPTCCMYVSVHAVLVPACCKTLSRHAQCITVLDASPGPTKQPAAALRHTVDLAVKNVMGRSV